ncbi:hypothetical protein PG995_000346 [Apiospora arundinis]
MSKDSALGTVVDTRPAKQPQLEVIDGQYSQLVPLDTSHTHELYVHLCGELQASIFAYMGHGPFESEEELEAFITQRVSMEARHEADPVFFAVITKQAIAAKDAAPAVAPGSAVGYLALTDMNLASRAIEIGPVNFAPVLQRTTVATEAMFLAMRYCIDTLGNRRLEWMCDSLNAKSRRAAERWGFTYEGTLRQHRIRRGRNRDTDLFSIIDGEEWELCKRALELWLDPSNFIGELQIRSLDKVRDDISKS